MSCVSRRTMKRDILRALAVSLVLASGAAGQDGKRDRIVAAFPADAVTRIDEIVDEAASVGVAADPIYDKALEGAAKRVPVPRILPALESYSARLRDSHGLLGDASTHAAVVAGADALARGVPRETVRAVGRDAGDRGPVALVVLGDLAEAGVPADGALAAVRQALDANQERDAVLHVPAAVRRLLRDGRAPDRAVHDVTQLMRDGVPPQRIRDGRGRQP